MALIDRYTKFEQPGVIVASLLTSQMLDGNFYGELVSATTVLLSVDIQLPDDFFYSPCFKYNYALRYFHSVKFVEHLSADGGIHFGEE